MRIQGIYNYCDRRCGRCAFTAHCALFHDARHYETAHPDAGFAEHLQDSFQRTFELLEAWCDREGIDFEAIRREASSPECLAEIRRMDDRVDAEPLMKRARAYGCASLKLLEALEREAMRHAWPSEVRDAVDTIGWFAGMVGAKVNRALHGLAEHDQDSADDEDGEDVGDGAIQNDWNGSAKVARLAIAESTAAWNVVLAAGEAPPDSPIGQIVGLLAQIDAAIVERFPQAMAFVRPGFDQPQVAAGA